MKIEWVGKKAIMASEKHFNGMYTEEQMTIIARFLMKNITHKGVSDRSNNGHPPSTIIWTKYNDDRYALVLDTNDLRKGMATIISFYDLNPQTITIKAQRFNMKEV